MSCIPCQLKNERLQFKLSATKQRAYAWAKAQNLKEVVVFMPKDEEGENDCFSYAATAPDGATRVEYLSVV
jgi:hypothetical protein